MSSWPKVPTNYCICFVISTYAAIGKLEEATEIIKLSKKTDRSNEFVFNDEGIVLLLKGEFDQAIHSFKQAVAFQDIPGFNFYLGFAYYLNADPIFDELRGNTTFIELTQMLGFDK